MSKKRQCSAHVGSITHGSRRTCSNPAKITHDGRWYCGVHDPVRLAACRAANEAAWRAEFDAISAQHKRDAQRAEAEAAIVAWCRAHPDRVQSYAVVRWLGVLDDLDAEDKA